MPDKWPLANGNWSNAANWNGGTKPLPGDDVFADGRTVTIDEDVLVASIRNNARSGGTAGGAFLITSAPITVQATLIFCFQSNTNLITVSNATGTVGIVASAFQSQNSGISRAVVCNGAGTVNISGNISQPVSFSVQTATVSFTGSGTYTFTGNVAAPYAGSIAPTTNVEGGIAVSAGSVTINGTVTGSASNSGYGLFVSGGACSVLGSVVGGSSNGTVNCSAAGACVIGGTLTIVGSCVASSNQPGVTNDRVINTARPLISGAVIVLGTLENHANGMSASQHGNTRLHPSGEVSALVQTTIGASNGSRRALYTGGVNLGQPLPANVRFGTNFGAANEYTGTLRVPAPQYVSQGVLTDNTVGTLEFDLSPVIDAVENINLTPITDALSELSERLTAERAEKLDRDLAEKDDVSPTINFNPTIEPTPVTVNPTPVTVNPVFAISIPAIEAESIVLDQEVTKYRGTLWSFTVEGLIAIPAKAYWTIKRSTESDSKAALQVVANNPTANGDGLKILNGVAVVSGEASRGSISYETYTAGGNTRYRALLRLLPTASAAIIPDLYKLDLKDVTSDADAVLAECVLRVVNPVTLATS